MPELPEVETVRRGLAVALAGRRLLTVEARRPDLRFPLPPDFAARLAGRTVEAIDRRAKYLLVRLDGGLVWLIHLGMSGRMVLGEGALPPPLAHDHVRVTAEGGRHVIYSDARRFGFMDLIAAEALDRHPRLAALGPEPLDPAFDGALLRRLLQGRETSLKAALLDQRLVAGLGNIYVCEALYRARLSPSRAAGGISAREAGRLAEAIREVLTAAIAAGGSSLRDYVQTSGELGYFQHAWAVYGREGEPCPGCRCEAGIARAVQAGRSTFYCPVLQR